MFKNSMFYQYQFCHSLFLISLFLFEILFKHPVQGAGIVELKILEWIPNHENLNCCQQSSIHLSTPCTCHYNFRLCIGLRRTDCAYVSYNFNILNEIPLGAQPQLETIKFTPAWKNTTVTTTVQVRDESSRRTLFYLQEPVEMIPFDRRPKILYREFYSSKLSFSIQVKCGENFVGADCGIYCLRPGPTDNYVCAPKGMVCKRGWRGQKCHEPVCDQGCTNGKCVAPNQCSCLDGWQGPTCSECIPYEGCQNGYCVQPNTCMCRANWGGKFCDKMLDRCLERPCKNGASCTTNGKIDYYECKCLEGYTGKDCTIPIGLLTLQYTSCTSNPCGPNGNCYPTGPLNDNFICQCHEGYFGPKCENTVMHHAGHIFDEMNYCHTENGAIYRNGQSWTTLDCQKCTCLETQIHCTIAKCEPRNCALPKNHSSTIVCPENQKCFTVQKVDCITKNCAFPTGFCRPTSHDLIENKVKKCRKNSKKEDKISKNLIGGDQECGKMFLKIDLEKVPEPSSVEQLCHHILLTLLAENLENYGFVCQRITKNSDIIQVNMASILPGLSVDRIETFIKNKISYNLTASPILHAVKNVWLENENVEKSAKILDEGQKNGEILKEVKSTNILVIVCILLLVVLILIFCSTQFPESGYIPCIKKKILKSRNRTEFERNERNRPIIRQNLKKSYETELNGSIFCKKIFCTVKFSNSKFTLTQALSSKTQSLSLEHELAQNLVNSLIQKSGVSTRNSVPVPRPPSPPPAYDLIEAKSCRQRSISENSSSTAIEMNINTISSSSFLESGEFSQSRVFSYANWNDRQISVV